MPNKATASTKARIVEAAFATVRDVGYAGANQGFGLRSAGRARLLLLDHTPLPFLETVAFEGNVADVGRLDAQSVDLKLRLRFWEF